MGIQKFQLSFFHKTYFAGIFILVVFVLGASIFSLESPQDLRLKRLDSNLNDDLATVAYAITYNYEVTNDNLVSDLSELDSNYLQQFPLLLDRSFSYEATSSDSFRICAQYMTSKNDLEPYSQRAKNPYSAQYEPGLNCFEYQIYQADGASYYEIELIDSFVVADGT